MRSLKRPPRRLGLATKDMEWKPKRSNAATPPPKSAVDDFPVMEWDRGTNAIKRFKSDIRDWLYKNQRARCAYCDFPIGDAVRRNHSIEHFIPKEEFESRSATWRFEPWNLLLSCDYCNTRRKRKYDPLSGAPQSSRKYRRQDFAICHPYFDNVRDHISGGFRGAHAPPEPVVALTAKGSETIRVFELDKPETLEEWHTSYRKSLASSVHLGPADQARLDEILEQYFKGMTKM